MAPPLLIRGGGYRGRALEGTEVPTSTLAQPPYAFGPTRTLGKTLPGWVPGTPTPPPPVGGPHDHFDEQAARPEAEFAFSLRDEAQLNTPQPGGVMNTDQVPYFYTYDNRDDPTIDGTQLEISVATWEAATGSAVGRGMNLNAERQLRAWTKSDMSWATDGNILWCYEHEFMFDDHYNHDFADTIGWNADLKYSTIAAHYQGIVRKRLENLFTYKGRPQTNGDIWCAWPRFRRYSWTLPDEEPYLTTGSVLSLDRTPLGDPQILYQFSDRVSLYRNTAYTYADHLAMVGGNTQKPYLIRPFVWNRVQVRGEFISPTQTRIWVYHSDEDTPPTLVMGGRALGGPMVVDTTNNEDLVCGAYNINEHNSSTYGDINLAPPGTRVLSWMRNAFALRGAWAPLGQPIR